MSQDDKKWAGLSRRTFLGTAAAAAGTRLAVGQQARDRESTKSRTIEADIVVVGGGLSGVCAALAAARAGSTVALIQDRSVLGGNSSSEVRMHIVGADHHGGRTDTDSRESGIIEELRLDDAVWNPQRSAASWDLLLYDKVRAESNIRLLLNANCVGVKLGPRNAIRAVIVDRPATHDRFEVTGRLFVDATGDGRVGFEAGAEFRVGRESRREFGESMALEEADGKVLGSSILFTTRKHSSPVAFRKPSWAKTYTACEELPYRGHTSSWEYGYWWVELGGDRDTIRDDEAIRDELLAAALGVWDHIKNSGRHPESENWALDWIGFIPGKRESRRLIGDYIMRQQDVEKGETFEDGIAYGGWPLDLHPPEGIYSKEKPNTAVAVPLYNIPFRSVYSRNIPNLFMAGRNISTSHVAFGSTRVMATCSVVGQAVGIAAALCVKNACIPKELCRGITELQQLLLREDLYLVGSVNGDSLDRARNSAVTASSEKSGCEATNVINGTARAVYSKSNRWMSDPEVPLPAWIELRLPEARRIREVHLVFDTGLNRQLTLTHSDAHNSKIIRAAQPETVRDYRLEAIHGETSTTVAEVTGNYQRRNVHRIPPVEINGIRLTVTATNGDKSARVFEMRLYE